jgi:hypothetical protein
VPEFEDYERQFLLERYKADRAHELEVEKFSSQFETAFIQSSALLNGAFAAGFLAFYGGTMDKLITSKKLVITSFGCWLVGLFLAILAGHVTYYGQQTIVSMLRNRRHARGVESLGEKYPHLLGSPNQRPLPELVTLAGRQEFKSKIAIWSARVLGVGSLLVAILGAASALATIWFSSKIGLAGYPH